MAFIRVLTTLFLLFVTLPVGRVAGYDGHATVTLGYAGSPEFEPYLNRFFAEVSIHLTAFDIVAVIQEDNSEIQFTFSEEQNGDFALDVQTDVAFLQQISPLLRDSVPNRLDLLDEDLRLPFVVAYVLYHQGNFLASQEIFHELYTTHDLNLAAYYLGNLALLDGQLSDATQYYQKYIYDWDAGQFVGHNLAWTYTQLGEDQQALALVSDALTQRESISACEIYSVLQFRANLYALLFDYTKASQDYNQVITLIESDTGACIELPLASLYTQYARVVFLTYEWDRVLTLLNTALEHDPTYAPAYFERGILYYTMTQRELALADFQMVIQLAPDSQHATTSQTYIESIQTELRALGQS